MNSIKNIFQKNIGLILLIFLFIFLIFGFKINAILILKYITLLIVIYTIHPYLKGNIYIDTVILLVSIIAVDIFYNTFYKSKPEYFVDDENTNDAENVSDEVILEKNVEKQNDRIQDNDINQGTIENVSYADADYKYKMSDLDGMVLEKKNEWRIMPKPESVPLSNKREYIVQGHDVPLVSKMSRQERLSNVKPPFVDGIEGSKRSMVMFDTNAVSLQCCPSTWSTDRGCVCFSSEQRDFINKRGGNRSFSPDQI